MPGIFFTNLGMLLGLTALSIPVLIHLLLRRKQKRARFSTLQFFVRHDEQAAQRRKLRNWFLLALRLLICALLVFAFARPYWESRLAAATRPQRNVIVVLDESLSMQALTAEGAKWTRAKQAALDLLADLRPSDRAALVGCATHAEVQTEWAPAAAVIKRIKELEPTQGIASLAEGLQQANRLLSLLDGLSSTTVCVVSDLQRTGSQNLANAPLPSEVEVKTIAVGDLITPNLAVVDLELERKNGANPHASIASFSDLDQPALRLDLSVDGKPISAGTFALPAGVTTNLDLALPALNPGWHEVAVRIQGRDALPADDARFQSVFVPQPAQVWIAETRPSERTFEEESFFVTTALDPGRDLTNGVQSRFVVQKMSPEELSRRLAAKGPARADLVVLPGLRQVPAGLGKVLSNYVEAGGGLLLFLGEGVSANRYNAEFRGLLPAQLTAAESRTDLAAGWRIGLYDTNSPVFAPFLQPNSGTPSVAQFVTRLQLAPGDSSSVLAQFADGVPFLLGAQLGAGRVVLANTSADTTWNDWPKHKSFVPWLHSLAQYLARLTSREILQAEASLVAGVSSDLELGPKAAHAKFRIVAGGMKDMALQADDQGALRELNLGRPGIYSVQTEAGVEVRRLAVNVPPSESDLAALSTGELQQQIVQAPDPRPTTLAAGLLGGGSNQREFWRVLLLIALGLLVVEMVVANRTHG